MYQPPKLHPLTEQQITKLAARPGVKKVAVENFLMTVETNGDAFTANVNCTQDARAYGWNAATQTAIRMGIDLAAAQKRRSDYDSQRQRHS